MILLMKIYHRFSFAGVSSSFTAKKKHFFLIIKFYNYLGLTKCKRIVPQICYNFSNETSAFLPI